MLKDRYENPMSTASPPARDAYVRGCDLLLSAERRHRSGISGGDRCR